jgi:hypothetical protein
MRPVATLAFLSCRQQVSIGPNLQHETFETRGTKGSRGRGSILGSFSNFGNLARFSPCLRAYVVKFSFRQLSIPTICL